MNFLIEELQSKDPITLAAICIFGVIIILIANYKFDLNLFFRKKIKIPRLSTKMIDNIYELDNELIAVGVWYNHWQSIGNYDSTIYNPLSEIERIGDISYTEIISSAADSNGLEVITMDMTDGIDLAESFAGTLGISAIFKGIKNYSKYERGILSRSEAISNTAIETGSVTTGIWGGIALATIGAAVLGAATGGIGLAILAGAMGGGYAGNKVSTYIKKELYDEDYQMASKKFRQLVLIYQRQLERLKREFINNFKSIEKECKRIHIENLRLISTEIKHAQPNMFLRFLMPNKVVKLLCDERTKHKKKYDTITLPWLRKLKNQFSNNGFNTNGIHLFNKGKDIFFGNHQLAVIHDDVLRIYQEVSRQKEQVEYEAKILIEKIS